MPKKVFIEHLDHHNPPDIRSFASLEDAFDTFAPGDEEQFLDDLKEYGECSLYGDTFILLDEAEVESRIEALQKVLAEMRSE